ncbi:MAG: glycosyltransferase [Candidatus Sumerlaeota bacterium]
MNILMVTNTFTPKVSGVTQSVLEFSEAYRDKGHNVWVVAPKFQDAPEDEENVIRVMAITELSESDFSFAVPQPGYIENKLGDFEPDIIHSHHPFSLGPTALRLARHYSVPLVYTYHTMYEHYTHYFSMDNEAVRNFIIRLAAEYADLCDAVIAPSQSVKEILRDREVNSRIEVIPTGVEVERFSKGHGAAFREKMGISRDDMVIGTVGRLEPEKNLLFLGRSVCEFMKKKDDAHFLMVGEGSAAEEVEEHFKEAGMGERLHRAGVLKKQELVDSYHAMDLFAFASKTETQGMVMTEAMAAGAGVVALAASGARDVVEDGKTGKLVHEETESAFVAALEEMSRKAQEDRHGLGDACRARAEELSIKNCAGKALDLYAELIEAGAEAKDEKGDLWEKSLDRLKAEWDLLLSKTSSVVEAVDMTFGDGEEKNED